MSDLTQTLRPVLDPLPPSPQGDLAIKLQCPGGRSSSRGHWVQVHPDWTATTVHDPEAEAIGVALGGSPVACMTFVDQVLPRVRDHLQVLARRQVVTLARHGRQWRTIDDHCDCGLSASPELAASHARTEDHARAGLGHSPFRRFTRQCLEAHGDTIDQLPAQPDVSHLVREPGGVRRLWACGVHPERVAQIHGAVASGLEQRLSVMLYLGVLVRDPDRDWLSWTLANTAREVGGRHVNEWLAWTETELDRTALTARTEWLATPLSLGEIFELSRAGVSASSLDRFASDLGSPRLAATTVLEWVRVGCDPPLQVLRELERRGVPVVRAPSKGAIVRLSADPACAGLSLTDVGLLLVTAGTAPTALHWIKRGVTDAVSLADALEAGPR